MGKSTAADGSIHIRVRVVPKLAEPVGGNFPPPPRGVRNAGTPFLGLGHAEIVASAPRRMAPRDLVTFNTTWSSDAVYTAASVIPHAYLYDNFAICADFDWRDPWKNQTRSRHDESDFGDAAVDERSSRDSRSLSVACPHRDRRRTRSQDRPALGDHHRSQPGHGI